MLNYGGGLIESFCLFLSFCAVEEFIIHFPLWNWCRQERNWVSWYADHHIEMSTCDRSERDALLWTPRMYSNRRSNVDIRILETRVTIWFIMSECVQGNWEAAVASRRVKALQDCVFWKNISIDGICIIFGILHRASAVCPEHMTCWEEVCFPLKWLVGWLFEPSHNT